MEASETNSEAKETASHQKVNGWIENILVFAVIPIVLFLLFLSPSIKVTKNSAKDFLLGAWKMGNDRLEFYADGTYSLNKKNGKVEWKAKNEVNLTSHGIYKLKAKENLLEFTDSKGKTFKWERNNFAYPGVWVAESGAILAFTNKNYSFYERKSNPSGNYSVKKQLVTLDKVGSPGKWSGVRLSWGGKNIYKKVLDKPILNLDKVNVQGSWETSNNRVLTFYEDGTYTFPDESKPHKAYHKANCGVMLDGISGVFVLTSNDFGAWCGTGGGKPLDYTRKK